MHTIRLNNVDDSPKVVALTGVTGVCDLLQTSACKQFAFNVRTTLQSRMVVACQSCLHEAVFSSHRKCTVLLPEDESKNAGKM